MDQKILSDGTVNWLGGMDTSRGPQDISEIHYFKAVNVISKNSTSGLSVRPGIHCCNLTFENSFHENIYRKGNIQAEGFYESDNIIYLLALVDGFVFRFIETTKGSFFVENITKRSRNRSRYSNGWIIQIPNGCIINNGFDAPIYIQGESIIRRLRTTRDEMPVGRMGIYLQNRLFMVNQNGNVILASDFMEPHKLTLEGTNIFGFMSPGPEDKIVAIGKRKIMMGTVESGSLIWSTNKNIYSADVRGTRSDWASLDSSVGKTIEVIPGFSAASSYSFESFNSNMYFRSKQLGLADAKQVTGQLGSFDTIVEQSPEVNYFFDNDTDWMLDRCYTKAYNDRILTTVTPEVVSTYGIVWNGIISHQPNIHFANMGTIPRKFESVWTGVRPWCLTVVSSESKRDRLFVHSHDKDTVNRLYVADEDSDYDVNPHGQTVEIKGFIETKGYDFQNPYLLKKSDKRFYRLGNLERSVKIKLFSRPENSGEWGLGWYTTHYVERIKLNNGVFEPAPTHPQTRAFVYIPTEKFSSSYRHGNKFSSIQYRIEFTGPIVFEQIITTAMLIDHDKTILTEESDACPVAYEHRKDFNYSIASYE